MHCLLLLTLRQNSSPGKEFPGYHNKRPGKEFHGCRHELPNNRITAKFSLVRERNFPIKTAYCHMIISPLLRAFCIQRHRIWLITAFKAFSCQPATSLAKSRKPRHKQYALLYTFSFIPFICLPQRILHFY